MLLLYREHLDQADWKSTLSSAPQCFPLQDIIALSSMGSSQSSSKVSALRQTDKD